MTIYYQSDDHLGVMLSTRGTIWNRVLPFCIYSSIAYLLVAYILPDFAGIDIRMGSSSSSDSLTLLISFLVVMRFDMEFSTFSSATAEFYHILGDCHLVASNARAFTASDMSPKANEWRRLMRVALVDFVVAACQSVQDDDLIMRIFEGELEPGDSDPLALVERIHDVIQAHGEYITADEHKLTIFHEMKMHEYCSRMCDEYVEVGKYKETPTPFPFVQVARVILYCYLLSLPLFISDEFSFANVFSIFFAVYGLFGLEVVSDEIGDPFGDDANDLEIKQMCAATVHHIRHQLDGDAAYYLRILDREYGSHSMKPNSRPNKLYPPPSEEKLKLAATKSNTPVKHVKDKDNLSVANDDADAYRMLGKDEMDMYNHDKALQFLSKALNCRPSASQSASILELMGDIYTRIGRQDKAIERYQEALRLKRKTKMMTLLSKIGDSFYVSGEHEKALSIYIQALPLKTVEEGWDSEGVAQMYHRIGLVYFELGDTDLALDNLWHALRAKKRKALSQDDSTYWNALNERLNSTVEEDIASVLFCMGILHEERCEYEWALTYLSECVTIQQSHPHPQYGIHPDIADTYLHIGAVHYKCGRKHDAEDAYNRARKSKNTFVKNSSSYVPPDEEEEKAARKNSVWREEAQHIWNVKSFIYPGFETVYDYYKQQGYSQPSVSVPQSANPEQQVVVKLDKTDGVGTGSTAPETWSIIE